ncbi:MAG: glycosyltransferase family 4 protein [Acidimicrobiales bacterium]
MRGAEARPEEAGLDISVVVEQLRRRVPGGIGTYALGLLKGLGEVSAGTSSPRPRRLGLLATPYMGRGDDPLAAYASALEVAELEILGKWWGEPLAKVAASAGSSFLGSLPGAVVTRLWSSGGGALRTRSDVVHSVSMAVPPTGGVPLTVMIHDVAWRQAPATFPRRGLAWHEAALRRVCRSRATVVMPSRAAAMALRQATAELDPARIEVIPHGVDHLASPDATGARRLLAKLGVEGGYILSVGTLEPRKNLRRLVEAYTSVRKDLPEALRLVIVGPAGWGDALSGAEGVVLAGQTSGGVLSGLYAAATMVAYVPLAEGYGLPAMEALAAGAPLIASTGVPSVLELAPSAARLVDPESTEAIAGALGELATDASARAELVVAAARAVTGLTWEESARRHLALWGRLAGAGGEPGPDRGEA